MDMPIFYVVPATTINAVLNHLLDRPYKEVAEVVKLIEGSCINVPPQMNILRELSRAMAPKPPEDQFLNGVDAPPPPPRDPAVGNGQVSPYSDEPRLDL